MQLKVVFKILAGQKSLLLLTHGLLLLIQHYQRLVG